MIEQIERIRRLAAENAERPKAVLLAPGTLKRLDEFLNGLLPFAPGDTIKTAHIGGLRVSESRWLPPHMAAWDMGDGRAIPFDLRGEPE